MFGRGLTRLQPRAYVEDVAEAIGRIMKRAGDAFDDLSNSAVLVSTLTRNSSERLRTKLALRPDWFQFHLPSGTHWYMGLRNIAGSTPHS